jgi:hypothetical protein
LKFVKNTKASKGIMAPLEGLIGHFQKNLSHWNFFPLEVFIYEEIIRNI